MIGSCTEYKDTSLLHELIFCATLSAWMFDFFMNRSYMSFKTTLFSKLLATLSARMFDSLMNRYSVFCEISLLRKFFATLSTRMFDSFMSLMYQGCWGKTEAEVVAELRFILLIIF